MFYIATLSCDSSHPYYHPAGDFCTELNGYYLTGKFFYGIPEV